MKSISFILVVLFAFTAAVTPRVFAGPPGFPDPNLTWYGQSFFVVTSKSGARIAFDPYRSGSGLNYSPPSMKADVVFVSHDHFDHNNVSLLKGSPKVVRPISAGTKSGQLTIGRQKFPYKSIFAYHDASGGKERGGNTIHVVTVDGARIAHLGDLGAPLTQAQIMSIGSVDILLVPVGGTFTIDAAEATKVVSQLKPRVVIPMHYKTDKVKLPLASVDAFLRGKSNVKKAGSDFSFAEESLPSKTTIYVLKYKE